MKKRDLIQWTFNSNTFEYVLNCYINGEDKVVLSISAEVVNDFILSLKELQYQAIMNFYKMRIRTIDKLDEINQELQEILDV